MNFSEEQLAAIEASISNQVVLACAGSGKTSVIVEKVSRLLEAGTLASNSIYIITFTNLATEELRARFGMRLFDCEVPNQLNISTIHSFCMNQMKAFDALRQERLRVLTEAQQFAILLKHFEDWGLDQLLKSSFKGPVIDAFIRTHELCDFEGFEDEKIKGISEKFLYSRAVYLKWCQENFYVDFSRILGDFFELLSNADFLNFLKNRLSLIVVDEYQDTDALQDRILNAISSFAPVVVVGDDDQCIYQFRGTTHKNIIAFPSRFSNVSVFTLTKNFRCADAIVRTGEFVVRFIPDRIEKPLVSHEPGGHVISRSFDHISDEAKFIAAEIERLKCEKLIDRYSQVGILYRSVTSSAEQTLLALDASQIPYVVRGDKGLMLQPEVQEVLALIEIVQKEEVQLRDFAEFSERCTTFQLDESLANEDLFGFNESELAGFGFPAESTNRLPLITRLRQIFVDRKFSSCFEFCQKLIFEYISLTGWSDRKIKNIGRLTAIIEDFDSLHSSRDIRGLLNFLASYGRRKFDAADPVECDDDAVNILTIHQAKGLEYSVVFIPMLVKGRFPLDARDQSLIGNFPSEVLEKYATSEKNERRLFYVAITRALDVLYLTQCADIGRSKKRQPSKFFTEVESRRASEPLKIRRRGAEAQSSLIVSYSQIELYLSCPYRFYLAQKVGLRTLQKPFYAYGRHMHFCLRQLHESHLAGSPMGLAELRVLYQENFPEMRSVPRITSLAAQKRGLKAIERYIENNSAWLEATSATELPFTLQRKISNGSESYFAGVVGQIDLVLEDSHGLHIVDFKTGQRHDYIDTELQLRIYASALAHLGNQPSRASVFYVENDDHSRAEQSFSVDSKWIEQGEEIVDKVSLRMLSRDYDATPGRVCSRCEYKQVCIYVA